MKSYYGNKTLADVQINAYWDEEILKLLCQGKEKPNVKVYLERRNRKLNGHGNAQKRLDLEKIYLPLFFKFTSLQIFNCIKQIHLTEEYLHLIECLERWRFFLRSLRMEVSNEAFFFSFLKLGV